MVGSCARFLSTCLIGAALSKPAPLHAQTAGDPIPEEKSIGAAVLLGLDPLPGDSLYYAGRKRQAAWNAGLGLLGAGLIAGGFASHDSGDDDDDFVDEDAIVMVTAGLAAYAGSLVWDAIGGIHGTAAYNRELREAKRVSVLPAASVNADGVPLLGLRAEW